MSGQPIREQLLDLRMAFRDARDRLQAEYKILSSFERRQRFESLKGFSKRYIEAHSRRVNEQKNAGESFLEAEVRVCDDEDFKVKRNYCHYAAYCDAVLTGKETYFPETKKVLIEDSEVDVRAEDIYFVPRTWADLIVLRLQRHYYQQDAEERSNAIDWDKLHDTLVSIYELTFSYYRLRHASHLQGKLSKAGGSASLAVMLFLNNMYNMAYDIEDGLMPAYLITAFFLKQSVSNVVGLVAQRVEECVSGTVPQALQEDKIFNLIDRMSVQAVVLLLEKVAADLAFRVSYYQSKSFIAVGDLIALGAAFYLLPPVGLASIAALVVGSHIWDYWQEESPISKEHPLIEELERETPDLSQYEGVLAFIKQLSQAVGAGANGAEMSRPK